MNNKSVLIIDDEVGITNLFDLALTNAGYIVYLANSGEEAFEILSKISVNVIITDLKMPGISGDEFCSEIKKKDKDIYIIALTGYHINFDKKKFEELGFDNYFFKPMSIPKILEVVEKAFESLEGR